MSEERKIYELGSLPDPLDHVPKPDTKNIAQAYFGRSNPWLDAADLKEMWIEGGNTVYQWRDSDVRIVIDNITNEIVNIYEL